MEYVSSYVYLGVVFTGPMFSMRGVEVARLTCSLGQFREDVLTRDVQFEEPRTKPWLFETLVTSTLLCGVQVWGPSLDHWSHLGRAYDGWRSMERPLVTMIAKMISCKASVSHDVIRAEMGAMSIAVDVVTIAVTCIHSIWRLPPQRYARLALESSRQLATSSGDTSCWFAQMSTWFELHGFHMDISTHWMHQPSL